MQCFICVIYLILHCKAQIPERQEISVVENKLALPGKVSSSNELDKSGIASQTEDEVEESSKPHFNSSQLSIELNEIELESTDEDKTVEEAIKNGQAIEYLSFEPFNKPESAEQVFSGIKKDGVKLMVSDANRSELLREPLLNTMSGMSHIGHSDLLAIIKPIVIVNYRGTVSNTENAVKIAEKRRGEYNRRPEVVVG